MENYAIGPGEVIDRNFNFGRKLVKKYLQYSIPCNSVLDLGAGHGHDLMAARELNPDAELQAIELCREYSHELAAQGFSVYNIDIEKDPLPFEPESVDVVIANQILEHTKEIFWIFHEITRVLPVGGKVIIGVPNLASLHNRILLLFGKQPSPIKSHSAHIRGFTRGDILNFLENCFPQGYKLRAFGGSNFYPFPPAIARPLARLFPTFAWGIFFLLEKQKNYSGEFLGFPVKQKLETNFYLGEK